MRTAIIVVLGLLLLGAAYYFLIYKPGLTEEGSNGSECDPNNPGFQKDGTSNSDCVATSTTPPVELPFNAGDDVYVPPLRNGYLFIYSYPQDNESTVIGRTTNALNGTSPLGKFVSMAGNGRFVKVALNGKTIEKKVVNPARPDSYSYINQPTAGDYYVLTQFVSNKQF